MSETEGTVAILGFGRSGTTWLSDIVSKAAGAAVLFEPLHPDVLAPSTRFSYRSGYSDEETAILAGHLRDAIAKKLPHAWLLRSHLPYEVHEVDARFVEQVWQEIGVLGFKEIRMAMAPDWVLANAADSVVFVVRHPLSVAASIMGRSNFWEYGWPDTFEVFIANALSGSGPEVDRIRSRLESGVLPQSDVERVALMWAVTHAIALPKLEAAGVPILYYENLYADPFLWARQTLGWLGLGDRRLLPTYLFTPAMTTHRTLHGLGGLHNTEHQLPADYFWRGKLSRPDQEAVLGIVEDFGVDLYATDGSPREPRSV